MTHLWDRDKDPDLDELNVCRSPAFAHLWLASIEAMQNIMAAPTCIWLASAVLLAALLVPGGVETLGPSSSAASLSRQQLAALKY